MNSELDPPFNARVINMTDAELVHLRQAVATVMREPNRVLTPEYWRRRILDLLERGSLLSSQVAVLNELLVQIDEIPDKRRSRGGH